METINEYAQKEQDLGSCLLKLLLYLLISGILAIFILGLLIGIFLAAGV